MNHTKQPTIQPSYHHYQHHHQPRTLPTNQYQYHSALERNHHFVLLQKLAADGYLPFYEKIKTKNIKKKLYKLLDDIQTFTKENNNSN
ncbi:hypothetical protein CVS40_3291 [Lucilia cuprina]|nr:hypothetical protein CVS40_3291 [Lucilia cuprina]